MVSVNKVPFLLLTSENEVDSQRATGLERLQVFQLCKKEIKARH